MSPQDKHYHRKIKPGKPASSEDDSKSPKTSRSESNSKGAAPAAELNRATGTAENDSNLHFGDTTLQTPEEHNTDKNSDSSKSDNTVANP